MKPLITVLMLADAALFVFGALQHAGVAIGPLHEPVIVPASVVEVLCASALRGEESIQLEPLGARPPAGTM
jgi:hypothetical protein